MTDSPVRPYRIIVDDSGNNFYVNRVLLASPVTGLVRVEWVSARYGQIIPVNWSMVQMTEMMSGYYPLRYQVADAQNLIVKEVITRDFEWLLLWEHDVIPPENTLIKINKYIREEKHPVVSGLYFTRSYPAEPLIFRGRGVGAYYDFKIGDQVWADGVPTGFLLIHGAILRAMWEDSEEYMVGRRLTRRIFRSPMDSWIDPADNSVYSKTGTSDLEWCTRVMEGKYFEKAGWGKYQDMEYPFLVDTSIFCRHIEVDGRQFPSPAEIAMFTRKEETPPDLRINVSDGIGVEDKFG